MPTSEQCVASVDNQIRPRHVAASITRKEDVNLGNMSEQKFGNVSVLLLTPFSSDVAAMRWPGISDTHCSMRSLGWLYSTGRVSILLKTW